MWGEVHHSHLKVLLVSGRGEDKASAVILGTDGEMWEGAWAWA